MFKRFVNTRFSFYLLLAISVFILFAHLGLPPLWGSEGRWAVIARSMLKSGELLSPGLGMRDYWDKPLLSYWQILPLSYLNGAVSEWTARFPSAVWAIIMFFLTYSLAKKWFDQQTALFSIGVLATTYSFVFWGRNAQVEMTNASMILLCLWYFLKHKADEKHTWIYGLGILMALGSNMKGPVLYAVVIFSILILSLIKKDWSWMPPLKILLPAGLLSLVLFLAVPILSSIHSTTWEPLHRIWVENVTRFFGRFDHKDHVYSYAIRIFDLAAPWSILLPVALIHSFRGIRRRLSQLSEPLILFGAIFIFFTISGSRRPYYLLPILPFVAVLVANLLKDYSIGKPGPGIQKIVQWIGILMGALLVVPLVVLFGAFLFRNQVFSLLSEFSPLVHQMLPTYTTLLWLIAMGSVLFGITMMMSTKKKLIWGMIGPVMAIWLIYVSGGIPLIVKWPNLKTETAQIITMDRPYSFLNMNDAKVRFYLDNPSHIFIDETAAFDWAKQVDGVLITPPVMSIPGWRCIGKNKHWQAISPGLPAHTEECPSR